MNEITVKDRIASLVAYRDVLLDSPRPTAETFARIRELDGAILALKVLRAQGVVGVETSPPPCDICNVSGHRPGCPRRVAR